MDKALMARCTMENLFDILNTITDGIYIADAQGNTIWLNKASENLCGVPKSGLIGRNVRDLEAEGIFNPSVTRMVLESGETTTTIQLVGNKRKFLVTGHIIPDQHGGISLIVAHSRDITEAARTSLQLEDTVALLNRYSQEIQLMKREQNHLDAVSPFIGGSRPYHALMDLMKKIAVVDTTVLITGETGVGKTVIAEHIHKLSERCNQPFIHINCSAIPESLIESELFGYQKGAFTGANHGGKIGLVKMAEKGTLFLDEISELPFHLQSKLLLLLQNKTYMPIGDTKMLTADVRIIAATNANLLELVKIGKFRHDLYYRLNILPINVPALRERRDDIFPLLYFYLKKWNAAHNQQRKLTPEVLDLLHHYEWPGNVRELENLVERIVITARTDEIVIADLPEEIRSIHSVPENILSMDSNLTLTQRTEKFEREMIIQALDYHKTTRKAAAALGISQSLLMRRIRKYGIRAEEDR